MKNSVSKIVRLFLRLFIRAAWLPMLVIFTHFILYNAFDLYRPYPVLNILVHFAGGIAIAYFFDYALRLFQSAGFLGQPGTILCFILLFSLTATSTVFWEFGEFISDHTIGTGAQLGLNDTLLDMAVGITGGLGYLVLTFSLLGYRCK